VGLLLQQPSLEQSLTLATVNSLAVFEILLLQQPCLEQLSIFGDVVSGIALETAVEGSPPPQLLERIVELNSK
jgi:hypothetical protein